MENNNHYLFYKKYFRLEGEAQIDAINREIYNSDIIPIPPIEITNKETFSLTTVYPGLLIGSGYGHDYKSEKDSDQDNAFKVGFYFDFSTGMPIITGSSIKGLLRSCFPQRNVKIKKLSTEFSESRTTFVFELLKEIGIGSDVNVGDLELEIFDGIRNGKNIPLYQRDIFFDAVPVCVADSSKLFADDYITPHIKEGLSYEQSLLKNPKPIKFLKVSPSVTYRFDFKLSPSKVCPLLTPPKKAALFKKIILTLGLGAKTNVGYGQFTEAESRRINRLKPENIVRQTFNKNDEKTAVISSLDNYYQFTLGENVLFKSIKNVVSKCEAAAKKKGKTVVPFQEGEKVKIRFNEDVRQGAVEVNFTVIPKLK